MDGWFYEPFGFEVAIEFFWLVMSRLGTAIVPSAIASSAVGGISGNRVGAGFVKVWDATVRLLRLVDRVQSLTQLTDQSTIFRFDFEKFGNK